MAWLDGERSRFSRLASQSVSDWSSDVAAGLSASVLAIAYGLSFASLIFAAPLAPWLGFGLTATLITMAVSASLMAARSSLPFVIAGPDGATAAVIATLVAALVAKLNEIGAPDDLLAPVMIVIALATLSTGLFLLGLGATGGGNAVRFIPFPVIGGFLAATGWLMASGTTVIVLDYRLSWNTLTHVDSAAAAKLTAAVAFALALKFLPRLSRNPLSTPAFILLGIALTHAAIAVAGLDVQGGQAAGWLLAKPHGAALARTWDLDDLRLFPWRHLPELSGHIFAVMFVTTVTMLLNTSGIEVVTRREADLARELKTIGVANVVLAALGGYVSCTSLSRTTLNYMAGARGRLGGFVVAAVALGFLAIGPGLAGYVPKFILGGLLLHLAATTLQRWLVEPFRRISRIDYVCLLAVTVIIVQWGYVAGTLAGIVIGCIMFAVSASRVNAIKFSFDGAEYRSSLDRSADEIAVLNANSREIQGLVLQGYLFFGSANKLYQHVKILLDRARTCRFLVIDFRLVTGMDSSAVHSFGQILQIAKDRDVRLVVVNMPATFQRRFGNLSVADEIGESLDHALERCENEVIESHLGRPDIGTDFTHWLGQVLHSAEHAVQLVDLCRRIEVPQGDVIARQGEPADSMHFIVEGRVAIALELEDGRTMRVRSLGPQTTIGEMGLLSGGKRSATVIAEQNSVLYILDREALDLMKREVPNLTHTLLTYVVEVMAERLRFSNNVIGVLRR